MQERCVDAIVTDPFGVAETFVTGMLPIEDLGGLVRITLYSERGVPDGIREKVIVARLLMTRQCFNECLSQSIDADHAGSAMKRLFAIVN